MTKSVPSWLLSFLIINVLYIFFKDVVFYSVFVMLYSTIIYLKIKNKSPFLMIEVLIFIINAILISIQNGCSCLVGSIEWATNLRIKRIGN